MKLRSVLIAAILLFSSIGISFAQASPASALSSGDFVSRINSLRASKGLGALNVDSRLAGVAQSWAQKMADANAISHNPSLSAIPGDWKKVGENVGTGGSVDAIFNALVASPGHYANMVDSSYNSVGVGIAVGSDGRIYTTHDFANYSGVSSSKASSGATTNSAAPSTSAKPKTSTTQKPSTTTKPKQTTTTVAEPAPTTTTTEAPPAPTPEPPAPVLPTPSTRIVQGLAEVGAINTQG